MFGRHMRYGALCITLDLQNLAVKLLILALLHLILFLHGHQLGTLLLGKISLLDLLARRRGIDGWQLIVTVGQTITLENIR